MSVIERHCTYCCITVKFSFAHVRVVIVALAVAFCINIGFVNSQYTFQGIVLLVV